MFSTLCPKHSYIIIVRILFIPVCNCLFFSFCWILHLLMNVISLVFSYLPFAVPRSNTGSEHLWIVDWSIDVTYNLDVHWGPEEKWIICLSLPFWTPTLQIFVCCIQVTESAGLLHLLKFYKNRRFDADIGMPRLGSAMCSLFILSKKYYVSLFLFAYIDASILLIGRMTSMISQSTLFLR